MVSSSAVCLFRGRKRVPVAAQGLPCCSAGAGPLKSQWAEPAAAGGGGGPPSEEWAARNGEQEEERRRSMDGGEPAERTRAQVERQSIHQSING